MKNRTMTISVLSEYPHVRVASNLTTETNFESDTFVRTRCRDMGELGTPDYR